MENAPIDWEIKIAWSEYQHGKWTRKRVSDPFYNLKMCGQEQMVFSLSEDGVFKVIEFENGHGYGFEAFAFNPCTGNVEPVPKKAKNDLPIYGVPFPANAWIINQNFVTVKKGSLAMPGANGKNLTTVLKDSPHKYQIVWNEADQKYYANHPFFFQDEDRAFLVIPSLIDNKNKATPKQSNSGSGNKEQLEISDMSFLDKEYWDTSPVEAAPTLSESTGLVDLGEAEMYYSKTSMDQVINRNQAINANLGAQVLSGSGYALNPKQVNELDKALYPEPGKQSGSKYAVNKQYEFKSFYHPYTCLFLKQLNRYGIEGLLNPNPANGVDALELSRQLTPGEAAKFDFDAVYDPHHLNVLEPYPVENIDFSAGGAYSQYNWELFFHCPFQIALKLSTDQKFEEAQCWFHYIFNPTESEGQAPQRFWKIKPFFEFDSSTTIQEIMQLINDGDKDMETLVKSWEKDPFQPHLIARFRLVAYMRAVVMKYLENLIAWGDQLFRQDSLESLNEATQLYILAAQILGQKPERIKKETSLVQTFALIRPDLDAFSNSLVDLENALVSPLTDFSDQPANGMSTLNSILYFCLPENSKLMAFWDTVANRLFKLRNCLNLEGIFRQLPLFQPPIDPALLVKAAAAGVDLTTALMDQNAPLPPYRFQHLLPRAMDFVNEVRSLGSNLLSAMEKQDGEALSALRAGHELAVHEAVKAVNELQLEEAMASLSAMKRSETGLKMKHEYYKNIQQVSAGENSALDFRDLANSNQVAAQGYDLLASLGFMVPDVQTGLAAALVVGGKMFGQGAQAIASIYRMMSNSNSNQADRASVVAGYDRRWEDWKLQERLSKNEIAALEKQIIAAEIRVDIAQKGLDNQDIIIGNAQDVAAQLKDKYTNKQLYSWMVAQVSTVYFQAYQMAYDLAKRVERCYQFELGIDNSSFIQFGYWDNLKEGLLSGERLSSDLRRMESAYLSNNHREYELTKAISLARLNPAALLDLRETGKAEFHIPEVLFDLDFSSQYMRRLKSVRLTIPCITGPHTSVSCKLTLMENRVRKNTGLTGGYGYQGTSDSRFVQNQGGLEAIATSGAQGDSGLFELNFRDERYLPFEGAGVVSSWEIELPEDYRQFDYDTISDVVLHLSYTAREGGQAFQNQVNTHLETGFNQLLDELQNSETGLYRMFSLKQEFPNELYQLLHPVAGQSGQETELNITERHLPYFLNSHQLQGKSLQLMGVKLCWKLREDYREQVSGVAKVENMIFDIEKGQTLIAPADDSTLEDPNLGNLPTSSYGFTTGSPMGNWKLFAEDSAIAAFPSEIRYTNSDGFERIVEEAVEDIYLIVNYKIT